MALLTYLAVNRDRHTRDSLSALLWPDYEQSKAFTNLRHTLWELQQTIGEDWIRADRETIEVNPEAEISVDVGQFESFLAQSRDRDAAMRTALLSDAVKLYRNHFLTGFSLKDAPEFNEWAFARSEELKYQFSRALVTLAEDLSGLGQAEQAIPYARRLITLDPLNETSHRQLIQVYIQTGQHSAALKQYQVCEQILRKELGIDPQPETRELYKKIRRREIKPVQIEIQTKHRLPSHNLPHQLSSFIGREKQQKTIARLIASHRLVTLLGAGGIGKTRLSLEVGKQLLADFAEGIWLVELSSLSDPALVPQAVSTVFGILESSSTMLTERLIQFLQSKTLLLILDNCEHLIDASAQLAETLLKNCPNLKILATSREPLGLVGEALHQIPSLSMPKENQVKPIADFEAIRLFTERARLSVNDFSLTPENASVVANICHRLDGIPLAIELAAARVNTLSVEQIAARLHDSFKLLASNSRTKLARQQTLQASIDWSWSLLSDPERLLLRRLSVFAGGWTLDAAESICSGDAIEPQQVLDLMTQLVVKSLVVVDQGAAGEKRYRLLEMIREYAREKLVNAVDGTNIHTLHLNYFLRLSAQARLELRGPSRVNWMERLHEDRNNLRAALRWAETTDIEAGLFLASQLLRFWESSDMREGIQWLECFLHKEEADRFPRAKAYALHAYASLLVWLQNIDQARLLAEECLTLFRATGDREGEVDGLLLLCNTFMFKNDRESAYKLGEQILALARSLNDPWREATALYYLGRATRDYDLMFSRWDKAIPLFRQVGDQISLASVLGWLGQFRVLNGDIDLAETYLDEAIQLWQFHKRANIWDNTKMAKSLIVLLRGDHEQANAMLQEILVTAEETGNTMSQFWAKLRLGYVALRSGNLTEAHQFLKEAAYKFEADGHSVGVMSALEGMAGVYWAVGKPAYAARLVGWSDAFRLKSSDPRPNIEQADVDKIIAACLASLGEAEFSDAYDQGKGMSMQDALVFAFAEN
jgi:predicted ATPase/Tfp pilus assembly protein PilF